MLKLLLAERVSIRNLHLILEAIAEIAPHVRRPEQSPSMCACASPSRSAAISPTAACSKVLRLGNRWDLAFHQSLKRDAKGEVIEFDIDPRLMEQFAAEAVGRDPQAHGRQRTLRAGRHAGDAPLCRA